MSKALTTERMKLDIRTMQDHTLAPWSHRHQWKNGTTALLRFKRREKRATIEITVPGKEIHTTAVELDTTAQHFGGSRVWWKCPCCHARVGVLYWNWRWQCRKCAELVHPSTRQSESSLAYGKVNRARRKLGWGGGLLSPMAGRKKGMHRRTYARLMQQLAEVSVAAAGAGDAVFERLKKRMKGMGAPTSKIL
jgi:hypothetical protein